MKKINHHPSSRRLLIILLSVSLIGAVTGVSLALNLSKRHQGAPLALTLLPDPRPLAEFHLLDHAGSPFTLDRLRGSWSLMFFGFTHCPDVCPSTLYDLNLVSAQLSQPGGDGEAPLQVVFVSIDPERDSPATLSRYVAYFNPEFTGVSGTHEELAALTRQLGIAYQIGEHKPGAEAYDVLHSSSVVLTDPDGQLRGAFAAPLDADRMARELAMMFGLAD